jgi:hypothetical protein
MRNGQHEKLLIEILKVMSTLGSDFAQRSQWAIENGISDNFPGTPGYRNKCVFKDNLFMVIRQIVKGQFNAIDLGYGNQIILRPEKQYYIPWTIADREISSLAKDLTSWVVYGIMHLTLNRTINLHSRGKTSTLPL